MEEIFISVIRVLLTLFFFVCLSPKQLLGTDSKETDYESLVALKNQFLKQSNGDNHPAIFMSSWNNTNHFCSWEGVTCGHKHRDRVIALDLNSSGLVGFLPFSIANLTFLKRLDLNNNNLYGEIPPYLFSRLKRLQYLDLSFNSLRGDIPANLMLNHSSVLQFLNLGSNQLITGKIPPVINSMSPLSFLGLYNNSIIGTIPPSLGNLSFLQSLYLFNNHLEGGIPLEIGGLHMLKDFSVSSNNLSGDIPSSFYNLSSLYRISLANNHFSGYISTSIAQAFPELKIFLVGGNHFIGLLDQALQNITSLMDLDISINNFTGVVPPYFGKMYKLTILNMQENEFEASDAKDWRFLDSLTNCTSLQGLGLNGNNLHGMLPKSFGNLSIMLKQLTLGSNHISGGIPFEIGKYTNLIRLGMEDNLLEGPIVESIGKLVKLQGFSLAANSLTGIIPYSFGNLTSLDQLDLNFNQLTGSIPLSLKNLQSLTYLDLSYNHLTSLIPKEIFFIPSLSNKLDLSYNAFSGLLPSEVGDLINLISLDFSNNNLTGGIPESLGSCQLLLELYMEYNFFQGSIPNSLGNIKNLEILDLSHNNLSGDIPQSLQKLNFLNYLNLSFNNLEGEVPHDGVFANSSAIFLIGNEKICGGVLELHLSKCIIRSSSPKWNHKLIKILIPVLSILAMLLALLLYYTMFCRKQKQSDQRRNSTESSLGTPFSRISYAKLAKATNYFSTSYLIGYGRYGSVYKGILSDNQDIVAIKVFKLEVHGAFKSFKSECEALRSIRHRNLVKVLTSCSSIDAAGTDFKALIFEYMPNGNLEMWLHKEYTTDEEVFLNLEKRLNIAIDVAVALEYLHHSCQPMIIHCDIKPSNILLDHDMVAHVGDFGLARLLFESISMPIQDSNTKSTIKGTIGYVAPEYGEGGHPSTSTDVYSFGILLLEMFTGRRPIDDMFKDDLNLHNHVAIAFPHEITDIVDRKMFAKENINEMNTSRERARKANYQSVNKCLTSMAKVGLSCSATSASDRPNIRDVVANLQDVKVTYLQSFSDREHF